MKVEGHSPALGFKKTDPFISDFFDNLEQDFSLIAADANMHILSRLRVTLLNRVFFITKDGLMGLGPRHTRPGDEVVVLSGSQIPFILRNRRISTVQFDLGIGSLRLIWQYRVLGDCYVHGIMNGEAVENFNWDTDNEVFDLM